MNKKIPLSYLNPGQKGTILCVGGSGPVRRRYLEMGFTRGETVMVRRVAPLGDPVEYRIKGYSVTLRQVDAARIDVCLTDN
jgi:Fe2+ transport system protein FeoA